MKKITVIHGARGVSSIVSVVAVLILVGCGSTFTRSPAKPSTDAAVERLGPGFASKTATVNGTTLHYVRGGTGPAVILLHGFPQDWYAFHRIMPRLAERFTVVSVDLRGVGGSAATAEGYDAATIAEDIRQLALQLKLGPIYIAGQNNGGIVAYAFARLYPSHARGVMILDVPLPGIEPWADVKADPMLWHFGFHQTPGLPEKLIAGRQFLYFREFFDRLALNRNAVTDADVRHYARAYAALDQLRAGLEFYRRAYPASEKFNAEERSPLSVPIVLAGGDHSVGPLNPTIADSLREHGCEDVTVELIRDSGHWVVDEQPEIVAELIERYGSRP